MLIQKSKVKSLINREGLRVSADAIEGIDRLVEKVVTEVCLNAVEDGMKTVMLQHCVHKEKTVIEKSNDHGLKPQFIQWAKVTQEWCHEQAVVLSRKV